MKSIITKLCQVASSIGSPANSSDLPLAKYGQGDQARHIDNEGNHRTGSSLQKEADGREHLHS